MALTLLRHAPPPPKLRGRFNGWSDIDIDRDFEIGDELRSFVEEKSFECIFSSDLLRCRATLDALGIENYSCDKRLRELRFKSYVEGRSFEELSSRRDYSPALLDSYESWFEYIADESRKDFEKRIDEFLAQLHPQEEILLCTHAGVIRHICKRAGKNPSTIEYLQVLQLPFPKSPLGNEASR